ncbi:hypothetical protein VTH82DRAFT_5620 [Thermothelomyces myriococcoides]
MLLVPWSRAVELIDYIADDLSIWPLWLCPLDRARMPTFHPMTAAATSGNNESDGFYCRSCSGSSKYLTSQFVAQNRGLEAKLEEMGVRGWLYAHVFYTEYEF